MTATEGEGVQVDWIDRKIDKVLKAKDHHLLAQNTDQMRDYICSYAMVA